MDKGYHIPKKRKIEPTKDKNLVPSKGHEIREPTGNEFDILTKVKECYQDKDLAAMTVDMTEYFNVIDNPYLKWKFNEYKRDAKHKKVKLEESMAFRVIDEDDEIQRIAKRGLGTGSSVLAEIGDPNHGVTVYSHPDTACSTAYFYKNRYIRLMIFKVLKGEGFKIGLGSGNIDCQKGYNYHYPNQEKYDEMDERVKKHKLSMLFFYEFDEANDRMYKYPAHVLPIGYVDMFIVAPREVPQKLKEIQLKNPWYQISQRYDYMPCKYSGLFFRARIKDTIFKLSFHSPLFIYDSISRLFDCNLVFNQFLAGNTISDWDQLARFQKDLFGKLIDNFETKFENEKNEDEKKVKEDLYATYSLVKSDSPKFTQIMKQMTMFSEYTFTMAPPGATYFLLPNGELANSFGLPSVPGFLHCISISPISCNGQYARLSEHVLILGKTITERLEVTKTKRHEFNQTMIPVAQNTMTITFNPNNVQPAKGNLKKAEDYETAQKRVKRNITFAEGDDFLKIKYFETEGNGEGHDHTVDFEQLRRQQQCMEASKTATTRPAPEVVTLDNSPKKDAPEPKKMKLSFHDYAKRRDARKELSASPTGEPSTSTAPLPPKTSFFPSSYTSFDKTATSSTTTPNISPIPILTDEDFGFSLNMLDAGNILESKGSPKRVVKFSEINTLPLPKASQPAVEVSTSIAYESSVSPEYDPMDNYDLYDTDTTLKIDGEEKMEVNEEKEKTPVEEDEEMDVMEKREEPKKSTFDINFFLNNEAQKKIGEEKKEAKSSTPPPAVVKNGEPSPVPDFIKPTMLQLTPDAIRIISERAALKKQMESANFIMPDITKPPPNFAVPPPSLFATDYSIPPPQSRVPINIPLEQQPEPTPHVNFQVHTKPPQVIQKNKNSIFGEDDDEEEDNRMEEEKGRKDDRHDRERYREHDRKRSHETHYHSSDKDYRRPYSHSNRRHDRDDRDDRQPRRDIDQRVPIDNIPLPQESAKKAMEQKIQTHLRTNGRDIDSKVAEADPDCFIFQTVLRDPRNWGPNAVKQQVVEKASTSLNGSVTDDSSETPQSPTMGPVDVIASAPKEIPVTKESAVNDRIMPSSFLSDLNRQTKGTQEDGEIFSDHEKDESAVPQPVQPPRQRASRFDRVPTYSNDHVLDMPTIQPVPPPVSATMYANNMSLIQHQMHSMSAPNVHQPPPNVQQQMYHQNNQRFGNNPQSSWKPPLKDVVIVLDSHAILNGSFSPKELEDLLDVLGMTAYKRKIELQLHLHLLNSMKGMMDFANCVRKIEANIQNHRKDGRNYVWLLNDHTCDRTTDRRQSELDCLRRYRTVNSGSDFYCVSGDNPPAEALKATCQEIGIKLRSALNMTKRELKF